MKKFAKRETRPENGTRSWLGLTLLVLAMAAYLLVRYAGVWTESDTGQFTGYIRDVAASGALVPSPVDVYPNGYLYQAVSTFILPFTGLNPTTLQQLVYPFVSAAIIPIAWITYRQLTGSTRAATLATLLLATQPDFLFVLLRSSHEKFTRALMFLCLLALAKVIGDHPSAKRPLAWVAIFALAAYGLIAGNVVLGLSFAGMLVTATVTSTFLGRWKTSLGSLSAAMVRWTLPGVGLLVVLIYLFPSYVYEPARHSVFVLDLALQQIRDLITGAEGAGREGVLLPYGYIISGWVNLPTYLVLSLANWLVIGGSGLIWLAQGRDWITKPTVPTQRLGWFLWHLYLAVLLQVGVAILSDATGSFGGNAQIRLFPTFSMIAVAILGKAATELPLNGWITSRPRLFTALASAMVALAVIKATNEPLLSNKWTFYDRREIVALRWADTHVTNGEIWTDVDERLIAAYRTELQEPRNQLVSQLSENTRDVVLSAISRARISRLNQPLPVTADAWLVYDNGEAQAYHLPPDTPFQH